MAQTLYDKLWNTHVVHTEEDGTTLLYIDRQLLHEVTSPQAFEGLKMAQRPVWRISANLAVSDHNVPTTDRSHGIADPVSKLQVDTLDANCDAFGITQFKMNDVRQGIVHIIGPEQGATLPGMTIVCGDSHTSTHGAFGALAHGIGTSEVEHVLATQTLLQKKSKNMLCLLYPHDAADDLPLLESGEARYVKTKINKKPTLYLITITINQRIKQIKLVI
ncbi:aconitase family protein, partial [Burkholderia cenocepacia]|uniref:aconitase family protein n=1 Tax=Burkholderia cenocepacia TaxID=95486 RepID=UPI002118ADA0